MSNPWANSDVASEPVFSADDVYTRVKDKTFAINFEAPKARDFERSYQGVYQLRSDGLYIYLKEVRLQGRYDKRPVYRKRKKQVEPIYYQAISAQHEAIEGEAEDGI